MLPYDNTGMLSGGDLASSLGGTEIFFADQEFRLRFFWGKKFPFSQQKFLMTFFLVIDQVFRIFPFFSQIFRILTMLNVVYDPFLTTKTPFFTLFVLLRASDNTTSQNIRGGDQCMGCPPPQILGGLP